MKIRFGIVGTGKIVEEFIEAVSDFSEIEISSLYSRTLEGGEAFAKTHNIDTVFTDLDLMIKNSGINAVYIASPNSLHCSQSIKFLENKIAVLCEKPLASNEKEVKMMIEASVKNNTLFMEAIKTVYMPNFKRVKDNLKKIGEIRSVYINFCQYSSRYDKFREGIVLNAFKRELSNGSTMDIGVYPVYFAITLFGEPISVSSQGYKLHTGVDGAGVIILKYDSFSVILNHSKINNSYLLSEISGEEGAILIEKMQVVEKATLKNRSGESTILTYKEEKKQMYYEIEEFIDCYKKNQNESKINPHKISEIVMKVLDKSRKDIGIVFPADKNF